MQWTGLNDIQKSIFLSLSLRTSAPAGLPWIPKDDNSLLLISRHGPMKVFYR